MEPERPRLTSSGDVPLSVSSTPWGKLSLETTGSTEALRIQEEFAEKNQVVPIVGHMISAGYAACGQMEKAQEAAIWATVPLVPLVVIILLAFIFYFYYYFLFISISDLDMLDLDLD